ncbi:MAG: anaerobic ribonucleoside-triphosphate reductase activating protein [Anaerorhabdus sp.]
MNYHNITNIDMVNGEGLRVVLWLAGCAHQCPSCHNESTWDENGGIPFDDNAKNELFSYLKEDYISGLTLSGGDPLFIENRVEITDLLKEIRSTFPDKNIWVYTGYLYNDVKNEEFMDFIDVLVDGRYEENLKSEKYPWAGSTNQLVIDVKKTKKEGRVVVYENN